MKTKTNLKAGGNGSKDCVCQGGQQGGLPIAIAVAVAVAVAVAIAI
jgi:hypothetical protein